MRVALCVILILLLARDQSSGQQTAADTIRQQIAAIPPESSVEIRLKAGGTLRGHIENRTDVDFVLKLNKRHATRTLAYNQVLSVSQPQAHRSHTKWIILGVVVGALAVVVIVVVAVAKTHPIGGGF